MGEIGPGCSILAVSSVVRFFKSFLPGCPVGVCMMVMSPNGLGAPLFGVFGIRPFVDAEPLVEAFVLFCCAGIRCLFLLGLVSFSLVRVVETV